MTTLKTITQIQDAYIERVLNSPQDHELRAKKGAAKVAGEQLSWLGFTTEQARKIIRDAQDMVTLHKLAA